MSIQETTTVGYFAPCFLCKNKSQIFLTAQETIHHAEERGWAKKVILQKEIRNEVWLCPECMSKINALTEANMAQPETATESQSNHEQVSEGSVSGREGE